MRGKAELWLGLGVTAAAVLLGVSVFLPWVRLTLNAHDLPSPLSVTGGSKYVGGLDDAIDSGWVTLFCAVAAGALAVIGGIRRNGRLVGAAVAPAAVALVALVAVPFEFGSVKTSVLSRRAPVAELPPVLANIVKRAIDASLDVGWYLALLMALMIAGLGVAALVTPSRPYRQP